MDSQWRPRRSSSENVEGAVTLQKQVTQQGLLLDTVPSVYKATANSYIHLLLLQDVPDSHSKHSGYKAFLTLYASSRSSQKAGVMGWYMLSTLQTQSLGTSWGSPHSKDWDFKRILLNRTKLKSGEETEVSLPFIWSWSLQWQHTVSGLEDKEIETSSSWWCAWFSLGWDSVSRPVWSPVWLWVSLEPMFSSSSS